MKPLGGHSRQLRLALQQAPDHAVGRVVAMLAGLPDRGLGDALPAGAPPRLRRLPSRRPLRLRRLLFLPLEGALAPASGWTPGMPILPRSAIGPIAALVRGALPELVEEVEASGLGHSLADPAMVASLGARLWPAAGLLATAQTPCGWIAAGLPEAAAAPTLALCAAIWRQAVPLWQARMAAAAGREEAVALASTALTKLVTEGPGPLSAGLALLLRSALMPGRIATLAIHLSAAMHPVVAREVARLLDRDAAAVAASASPHEMAEAAMLLASRLADLERGADAAMGEAGRHHAAMLRQNAAEACHAQFAAALEPMLLAPLARAAAAPRAEDGAVAMLEGAARDLRRLDRAGRELGQAAAFDRSLHDAAARISQGATLPRGLNRIEIARLVEILAGPDAALRLADAAQGGA